MRSNTNFERRLARLLRDGGSALLRGGLKGLEKESLRVTPKGCLAQTPHPAALGAALTHPHITTDYSEALLEFVTPPLPDTRATLVFLDDIHAFVYRNIGDEMLWATSMPCPLDDEHAIPIARYGSSNVGMMKHVYRRGLAWRYGRRMQTISGVHFNYSFPLPLWPVLQALAGDRRSLREFTDEVYFGMLRNFLRVGWIIPFLFGASPAVCKSFLPAGHVGLEEFDPHTWYGHYATSLRLSDIGYKNKNQAHIGVSYNSPAEYIATLTRAISTPEPEYQRIGVKVNGEYRQLNANILQIENEFYGYIRPKQPIRRGERPTVALKKRGVLYTEVRALDLNAYDPTGVGETALRFIEALLIWCLLNDSPPLSAEEQAAIGHNQLETARRGRDPALRLVREGREVQLGDWAREITGELEGICEALDGEDPARPYSASLTAQREAIREPERLPSARILAEARARGESFFAFARRLSEEHRAHFLRYPLAEERRTLFERLARESLAQQAELEATDRLPFDEYLERYFRQS